MAIESNINTYYEEQIDSIAEFVMDRVKELHEQGPDQEIDDLNDIIDEEIDTRSIAYVDRAYYLARYYLENGDSESIDWSNVWEMVFNDVYKLVDEQIKEKYGEEAEEE